jgi:hypothetical protein
MQADRLALCSYLMTGQVLQGADTGSILMFSVPKEYGERGMSENVLHVSADSRVVSAEKRWAWHPVQRVQHACRGPHQCMA